MIPLAAAGIVAANQAGKGPTLDAFRVTALHAFWASDPTWTPPADGAQVTSWKNHAGTPDATIVAPLTAGPLYRAATSAYGNRPTLEWFGTANQGLISDVATQAQPFKLLLVGHTTVAQTTLAGLTEASVNRGIRRLLASTDAVLDMTSAINGGGAIDAPQVVRATLDTTSSTLWTYSGAGANVSGSIGVSSMTGIHFGHGSSPTLARWMTGHLAFVGLYASSTLDADLDALALDLKSYYAIT